MKKSIIAFATAVAILSMALAGCGSNTSSSTQTSSADTVSNTSSTQSRVNPDSDQPVGYQLELPKDGEEYAIIETSMGAMKMRLFANATPKTVENFTTLAKQGYYDGQIFHRVINEFMIQGGDPTGTGTGGKNIWDTDGFEDEFAANLLNIRGSVAMANRGKNTNGSQFFINQKKPESFEGWDYYTTLFQNFRENQQSFLESYGSCPNMFRVRDNVKNLYEQYGGNPKLDGYYSVNQTGHTVFGQVFEGLEVLDSIAAVEVDNADKPVTDVVIQTIKIEVYNA